ncbi:MAG: phosphatidate cytidylyltransferase [Promicromonosporaceae bacterium]|nr:phosphatidate cytidylyltransferase [Promicromonosporaceae bacterium]
MSDASPDQPAASQSTGRAGRNLPAAIAVAVVLLVVVAASLAFRPEPFVAVVAAVVCLGLWELRTAFARRELNLPTAPLLVGAVGILIAAHLGGGWALLSAYVLTILAVIAWQLIDGSSEDILRSAAAGTFAVTYLPLLAAFVVLMLEQPEGNWRIAMFILFAVANDTGGYIAGVLFGKHPLAPNISPKKSWEGMVGSVLATVAVGVIGSVLVLRLPLLPADGSAVWRSGLVFGLGLGVLTAFTATVGDLAESLLKRDLGVKDMGSLLPGHGGVLDRVDSIVFSAPFVYLAFSVVT